MKEQQVLITGGASGIGLAMVQKFAEEGARVFFIDTNSTEGQKTETIEREKGHQVTFWHVDITSLDQIKQKIQTLSGKLHALINNAGISHIGKLENTNEEDFDRIIQVNVKGMFLVTKAALPKLISEGGGAILNLCSVAATMGIPDRFAYSMSKGAVLSMTLSIARDYVDQGIRCNCLSPGRVHTPFVDGFLAKNYPGKEKEMFEKLASTQAMGRMGKPEEIAALAYFLCSEDSKFITGTNFNIDGGFQNLKM